MTRSSCGGDPLLFDELPGRCEQAAVLLELIERRGPFFVAPLRLGFQSLFCLDKRGLSQFEDLIRALVDH
jgi:hypothetical protein